MYRSALCDALRQKMIHFVSQPFVFPVSTRVLGDSMSWEHRRMAQLQQVFQSANAHLRPPPWDVTQRLSSVLKQLVSSSRFQGRYRRGSSTSVTGRRRLGAAPGFGTDRRSMLCPRSDTACCCIYYQGELVELRQEAPRSQFIVLPFSLDQSHSSSQVPAQQSSPKGRILTRNPTSPLHQAASDHRH
ncbi:hypothetical protein LIA77_01892 [Sarocladium implicatum]|nr:hypothetical protein LIA77_01892 [Sarocladium implicatum]